MNLNKQANVTAAGLVHHAPCGRVNLNYAPTDKDMYEFDHAPCRRVNLNDKSKSYIILIVQSRPVWACEFKLLFHKQNCFHKLSRPVWACEFKCTNQKKGTKR